MKILWIEDFGGGVDPSQIAKSIFDNFVGKIISEKWDQENSIQDDFSNFIKDNSLHEIDLIKNYPVFKEKEEDIFEYDYILIDINLSEGLSPREDNPDKYKDDEKFHECAGLYVFNFLVQEGFPFENIAFMSGEEKSTLEFYKKTEESYFSKNPISFGKDPNGYLKISKKLTEMSINPYLILRRGIIEACRFLKNEFENKTGKELDDYLLFYKTTNEIVYEEKEKNNQSEITDNSESIKEYVTSYLIKLESFFPLNPPSDNKTIFYRFVRELAVEWEISKGFLQRKDVEYTDEVEFNFKNFCQNQMKLLRNWTAHNQLSHELTEKEISFYFLIAMRALFNLDINETSRYEKILFSMFEKKLKKEAILKNLADSYFNARKIFEDESYNLQNPRYNEFNNLLSSLGDSTKYLKRNKNVFKKLLSDKSKLFFYQNFWHGLFPTKFKVKPPNVNVNSVRIFVDFDYKNLKDCSFLNELAKSIYNESF
ncbi:MAG: hypothetical protein KAW92_15350 [Candidatus Cloacimonetes bacterium]|nr:hypothetical protein [Candidatus Cloacimonadota bacterium]